MNYRKYLRLCE